MKKLFFIILATSFAQLSKGQELKQAISLTLINSQYSTDNSILSFDLKFKNNTDSAVYILKPETRFFNITYKEVDVLGMYGLSKYPYQLSFKDCKINVKEQIAISESGNQFELLRFFIRIPPNSIETFKNIKIVMREGAFCKNQTPDVQLKYNPEFMDFERYNSTVLKRQFELVSRETINLDNMLTHEGRMLYLSESENFKKLNEFIRLILPSIIRFNGESFVAQTIILDDKKEKFKIPENFETFTYSNYFSISYPKDWKKEDSAFIEFMCALTNNGKAIARVSTSIIKNTTFENCLRDIFAFSGKQIGETTQTTVSNYDAVSFYLPKGESAYQRHLLVKLDYSTSIHFSFEYPSLKNWPFHSTIDNIEKSIVILR